MLLLSVLFIWYAVFRIPQEGILKVWVLDVGQGDALFIETPSGNQILVDGGPAFGGGAKVLSELGSIMPAYDHSINVVLATHTDADHIGGLPEVLKRYDVDTIIDNGMTAKTGVYQALYDLESQKSKVVHHARAGDRIVLDKNITLDLYGPFDEDFTPIPATANEVMVVGRLLYGSTSFLLMGDLEKGDELRLAVSGLDIKSTVLKVAHHGSKYSSTELFLNKVLPEYAVVSVGKENRYGHPTQEALQRLRNVVSTILRTDQEGRVLFESDGVAVRRVLTK